MLRQGNITTLERERALALGMREVASELRLIDAVDLVAFIRSEQFANVRNLVSSSTEMFFRSGTVTFGLSGDAAVKWGEAPTVSLDMEFHNKGVNAYFRLLLEADQAGVEIGYITFENPSDDPEANTARLVEAIADARLSDAFVAPCLPGTALP